MGLRLVALVIWNELPSTFTGAITKSLKRTFW